MHQSDTWTLALDCRYRSRGVSVQEGGNTRAEGTQKVRLVSEEDWHRGTRPCARARLTTCRGHAQGGAKCVRPAGKLFSHFKDGDRPTAQVTSRVAGWSQL
jgi:hypothetical protein